MSRSQGTRGNKKVEEEGKRKACLKRSGPVGYGHPRRTAFVSVWRFREFMRIPEPPENPPPEWYRQWERQLPPDTPAKKRSRRKLW